MVFWVEAIKAKWRTWKSVQEEGGGEEGCVWTAKLALSLSPTCSTVRGLIPHTCTHAPLSANTKTLCSKLCACKILYVHTNTHSHVHTISSVGGAVGWLVRNQFLDPDDDDLKKNKSQSSGPCYWTQVQSAESSFCLNSTVIKKE